MLDESTNKISSAASSIRYELSEYSQHLREARRRLGLSQRELAEKIGTTQAHISRIEAGSVDLQLTTLVDLARALELDVLLVPAASLPSLRALLASPGEPGPRPRYRLEEEA